MVNFFIESSLMWSKENGKRLQIMGYSGESARSTNKGWPPVYGTDVTNCPHQAKLQISTKL